MQKLTTDVKNGLRKTRTNSKNLITRPTKQEKSWGALYGLEKWRWRWFQMLGSGQRTSQHCLLQMRSHGSFPQLWPPLHRDWLTMTPGSSHSQRTHLQPLERLSKKKTYSNVYSYMHVGVSFILSDMKITEWSCCAYAHLNITINLVADCVGENYSHDVRLWESGGSGHGETHGKCYYRERVCWIHLSKMFQKVDKYSKCWGGARNAATCLSEERCQSVEELPGIWTSCGHCLKL